MKIQSLVARLLPRQELSFSNKREPLQSLCQSYLAQGMFLFTLYRRRRHVFLCLGQGYMKTPGTYFIPYSNFGHLNAPKAKTASQFSKFSKPSIRFYKHVKTCYVYKDLIQFHMILKTFPDLLCYYDTFSCDSTCLKHV